MVAFLFKRSVKVYFKPEIRSNSSIYQQSDRNFVSSVCVLDTVGPPFHSSQGKENLSAEECNFSATCLQQKQEKYVFFLLMPRKERVNLRRSSYSQFSLNPTNCFLRVQGFVFSPLLPSPYPDWLPPASHTPLPLPGD